MRWLGRDGGARPADEAERLARRWESLSHGARQRDVAMWARTTGDVGPVLAELARGDLLRRRAALLAATVARHGDTVATLLGDPDASLRAAALRAAARLGGTALAAVVASIDDLSADERRRCYRLVRQARRADLAESLVDRVRERFGDREAAALLPACGEATARRLLPVLGHAGTLAALARAHPAAVLDDAERQLAALGRGSLRDAWWLAHGDAVLAAADALPHRVLDVLERHAPSTTLPGAPRRHGVLAAADPDRLVALLAAPGRAAWVAALVLPRAVLDRLGRREPATVAPLARRLRDREPRLAALLRAFPPARREELYDLATAGVDTTHGARRDDLLDELLDALPRERRAHEARRMLALPRVRDDETATLRWTAFLPLAEAEDALRAATRRADADDRAEGYRLLVACAARTRDPAAVAATLRGLTRLRNEQDPVRAVALSAIAWIPPRLVGPDVLDVLTTFVTDATQARDGSPLTLAAVRDVVVGVLREHAADEPLRTWALDSLRRMFGHRPPSLGRLDQSLRRGQEHELVDTVADWLRAGVDRGDPSALFTVTRALGRRAWGVPRLQELLRSVIARGSQDHAIRTATALWLAAPATREDRVDHVLSVDESAITLAAVWAVVSTSRTDRLGVALDGGGPRGRFVTRGVRWVPPESRATARWTSAQRAAFVALHGDVAADPRARVWARAAAIRAAAVVPEHGWDVARRWADADAPDDVPLREAALAALPLTDRPADALAVLLRHADDDRARVALSAAGRAGRFVAPSRLAELLPPVATGVVPSKVTSRKEALRLATRLAVPGAADLVAAVWRTADEHRDVRAAAVAAATAARLARPGDRTLAWEVLRDAADGVREHALASLPGWPLATREDDRAACAAHVLWLAGSADQVVARAAWGAFASWAPWAPDASAAAAAAVADLDDRVAWHAAARAVTALVRDGLGGDALPATVAALVARLDEPDARDRDLPARRRLAVVLDDVTAWSATAGPDADREPVRAAALLLAADPETAREAATTTVAAGLDAVDAAIALVQGRPVHATAVARAVDALLPGWLAVHGDDAVHATAARLATGPSAAHGLVAVALARAGRRLGWPERSRALVGTLRAHPDADVRAAARDVVLHDEL